MYFSVSLCLRVSVFQFFGATKTPGHKDTELFHVSPDHTGNTLINFMKRTPIFLFFLFIFCSTEAQLPAKPKKYPSLLWEISGKGMKKPSFLIGTMHVSSKLAFNLPDSFYLALKSAQVVALETNPETWQEDMSRYELETDAYTEYTGMSNMYTSMPSDYLGINTLKFYKYDKKIERALYSNPTAINNLLYRSYGNETSDFEEDTYLDMYIFQCGKKWGKRIAGVEDYGKSMELMAEAYRDAAKDKNKKERSYTDYDEAYSADRLQEAYRRGNLDLLDTINKYNSISPAFDEKFLYRRNEIQATSIDSILKKGLTLFVGVGAAHLPGDRGVIELLRKMGYRVRPVIMGERAGRAKDLLDKIRVPVIFRTDTSKDGLFRVDIPGKFYKFGDDAALDQQQCADMANGSYYLVTRIMTNAWLWNHNADDVYRVVDSLLYENVPGKIITKTMITRNGYKGFDVVNRTRRGDLQRYNIFITPFEIIFFKISGNGDYVKNGPEAERFFSSIRFTEYKNGNGTVMKTFSPSFGGFTVEFPHIPYTGNDGSWIFDAADKTNGVHYRVLRTDIHNYHFAGEDTFDLGLLEESFMGSDFIATRISRRHFSFKGYPALEGIYKDKAGAVLQARFIIQGPYYYTLLARAKQETPALQYFLDSFEIKPFVYGKSRPHKDSSLYYSVTTPYFPEEKKIKLKIPRYSWVGSADEEEERTEEDLLEAGAYRNRTISNDSTGEKIYITFSRSSRYQYLRDSAELEKGIKPAYFYDSSTVSRLRKKSVLPDQTRVWETIISDTGSSRTLRTKVFYKDGIVLTLATQSDTLTAPSAFIKDFFETFTMADTLKGIDPLVKKSARFFEDISSADTILYNRAVSHIDDIYLDSTDLPQLLRSIGSLGWEKKKYLDTKKLLINKLGDIRTVTAADQLKKLYYALDDTVQLQYAVLENLLQQRTAYAYTYFREIIATEPPVLDFTGAGYTNYYAELLAGKYDLGRKYRDGKFLDELFDSLELTRTILPELLPLLNWEDYRETIMKLLGRMIDSNLVKPADYEQYYSKFLLEAKQKLKKQVVAEKKKSIARAEENKTDKKKSSYLREDDEDYGNSDLGLYAMLLLPFSERQPAVQPVIEQMLRSGDKRLRYNTFMLLMRKGRSFPDTMPGYFAGLDEYRYELYNDLKDLKKLNLFTGKLNTHLDLGRSALLERSAYDKPDSLIYLQRLPAEHKGKKGFVYFYKYKKKKDDLTWKLATVGLVPEDPAVFEFDDPGEMELSLFGNSYSDDSPRNALDFTGFSDTKLKTETALDLQLNMELKRMLYSRQNSAREFYKDEDTSGAELAED